MASPAPQDMLLISDAGPRGAALRDALPWTVVALREAACERPSITAIAADVALDDAASVALLRAALARYRPDGTMPFVVLTRSRCILAHATANGLGATDILPVDAPIARIAAGMGACEARDVGFVVPVRIAEAAEGEPHVVPVPADDDATLSITSALAEAEAALASLLASARERKPVEAETLQRGAEVIVAAIKDHSVREWVDLVRRYDDSTYQHVLLVAGLVTALAIRLGCSAARQGLLAQAALVHDIGKAAIPQAILNKPGPLTPVEMDQMRTHPSRGYYMIAHQRGIDPLLLDVVLNHHEHLDGSGYPSHRRGREISDATRLVTICDIFAALIERRAYKAPIPAQKAYDMLLDMGPKLDRGMLGAFQDVAAGC